ncbi:MAG: D-glycerate dehydrogenase [Candidatus Tectomicrobia bacterium]|nr:D-glycerate dehydrogenase [Candidatus Tectomicrobia bacterium]
MTPRPGALRVFLSRKFPPGAFEPLRAFCRVRVHPSAHPPSRAACLRAVRDAHVLISMVEDPVDALLLDSAPSLRLVANFGAGFNNIDLPAATARGVLVTNTPGVVAPPTAELTLALLLAAARRVAEADAFVRAGRWRAWTPSLLEGRSLAGRTLGIVGLGGVGAAAAGMARAFGMEVRYWSRRRKRPGQEAALGVRYRPFRRLLGEADFLSLHVALNDETRGLMGEAELALMKPGAFLINTARGAVVDEPALVRALRSGRLAGAGLDVFAREPRVPAALLRMKNVVLLPHLGTSTAEARRAMAERVIRNVRALAQGRRPPDLLNPKAWPPRGFHPAAWPPRGFHPAGWKGRRGA